MQNKIFFVLIFISLFSFYSRIFASELCSSNGYTVLTINGIFTNLDGAIYNRDALAFKLKKFFNNQPLFIHYLYNPTHLAGAGDLVDAIQQGLFDQKSDYDLVEMISDASQKVTTQKVLLVAHSQGNFYANNFYDKTASQEGGIPKESVGMYGVASPADRVAGDGKYVTSDTDSLIVAKVGRFLNILPPNIHILLEESDGNGHSFSNVYLKYKGDKIISDIKASLDKLKENDEQEPEDPCISPPELSVLHKMKGVVFAVADPTAVIIKGGIVITYNTGVYVATGLYKAGKAIVNTTIQIADATASSIVSLTKFLSGEIGQLAGGNSAAVILADTEVADTVQNSEPGLPQKDSSSQNVGAQLPRDVVVNDSTQAITETILVTESAPVSSENERENTTNNISPPVVVSSSVFYGGSVGAEGSPPPDKTGPIVTLLGTNPIDVIENTNYVDAGATALDNVDGVVSVVTSGTVDVALIGAYIITYTAIDVAGNTTTTTRIVNVIASPPPPDPPAPPPPDPDTTPPVITLIGDAVVTVTVGGVYADSGATATDDIDGNITANITVINPVDINTIGDYTITYDVKDVALNSATQVSRVVHIIASPPSFPGVILDNSKTGGTWVATPFIGQWASYCSTVVDVGVTCPSLFSNIFLKDIKKMRVKLLSGSLPNGPNLLGVSIVGNDVTTFVRANQLIAIGDGIYEYIFEEHNATQQHLSWVVIQDASGGNFTLAGSIHNRGFTYGVSSGYYPLVNGTFAYQLCDENGCGGGFTTPTLSSEKVIIAFSFDSLNPNVAGVIDETAYAVALSVPFGTNVTALAPTITISSFATISPNTNEAQNFTNPVTYTVTAENGSTQNYVVTVTVAPDPSPALISAEVKSATTVDLTFSKDLNGQTVTNADFAITGHTLTTPDASETETGPGIVRLHISDTFASGETPEIIYNTTVSNGVKDLDRNMAPAKTVVATNNI